MTLLYVRSTTGNDTNDGLSWATAKATLSGAAAIAVAGDTVYVSQVHDELQAADHQISWANSASAITKILCVLDSAEPPTTLATGAKLRCNGRLRPAYLNTFVYIYGLYLQAGIGSISSIDGIDANYGLYENCTFRISSNGSSTLLVSLNPFKNCHIIIDNASRQVELSGSEFLWDGGSLVSLDTTSGGEGVVGTVSNLFKSIGSSTLQGNVTVRNVDMSTIHANSSLGAAYGTTLRMVNCHLPDGFIYYDGVAVYDGVVEYVGSDPDLTDSYRRYTAFGSVIKDYSVVMSNAYRAHDGTSAHSLKLTTTAPTVAPNLFQFVHTSPDINFWNTVVGSSITVSLELIYDSVTALTNEDVWLEVYYKGTASSPLGVMASNKKGIFETAVAHPYADGVNWEGAGLDEFTDVTTQVLSLTFTPTAPGYLTARVCMAKQSTTIYLNPKLQITL